MEQGSSNEMKHSICAWGEAEDQMVITAVRQLGTQWAAIAEQLPGRTADAVRNRWHRLQKQPQIDRHVQLSCEHLDQSKDSRVTGERLADATCLQPENEHECRWFRERSWPSKVAERRGRAYSRRSLCSWMQMAADRCLFGCTI